RGRGAGGFAKAGIGARPGGLRFGRGRWRIARQPVDRRFADERIDARLLIEGKERAGGEVAVGGHAFRHRLGWRGAATMAAVEPYLKSAGSAGGGSRKEYQVPTRPMGTVGRRSRRILAAGVCRAPAAPPVAPTAIPP